MCQVCTDVVVCYFLCYNNIYLSYNLRLLFATYITPSHQYILSILLSVKNCTSTPNFSRLYDDDNYCYYCCYYHYHDDCHCCCCCYYYCPPPTTFYLRRRLASEGIVTPSIVTLGVTLSCCVCVRPAAAKVLHFA